MRGWLGKRLNETQRDILNLINCRFGCRMLATVAAVTVTILSSKSFLSLVPHKVRHFYSAKVLFSSYTICVYIYVHAENNIGARKILRSHRKMGRNILYGKICVKVEEERETFGNFDVICELLTSHRQPPTCGIIFAKALLLLEPSLIFAQRFHRKKSNISIWFSLCFNSDMCNLRFFSRIWTWSIAERKKGDHNFSEILPLTSGWICLLVSLLSCLPLVMRDFLSQNYILFILKLKRFHGTGNYKRALWGKTHFSLLLRREYSFDVHHIVYDISSIYFYDSSALLVFSRHSDGAVSFRKFIKVLIAYIAFDDDVAATGCWDW